MVRESSHILVEKAFVYRKKRKTLEPRECVYDFFSGGWLKKENGKKIFLVKSNDPNEPLAGTKKADIETGEDQKSE